MEKNSTNGNEIFEILLRDSLSEKLKSESEELSKSDSEHDFENGFSKGVHKIARGINREENVKTSVKVTLRSLASVACVLGIVFCLLLTQPAVYAAVKNTVRTVLDGRDKITFVEPDEETDFNTEIRPQYIPEGFDLRMIYYSYTDINITYEDIDGRQLCFDYGLITEGTAMFIDNDNHVYSSFMVGDIEYHYYEATNEEHENILMWVENGYYYQISAQMEKGILMQIAENIK